jgi:hypothetical protein
MEHETWLERKGQQEDYPQYHPVVHPELDSNDVPA